jgi:aminoglycoside 3-N-acetyltransferase
MIEMPSQAYIPCREIPSHLGVREGEIILLASDLTRLAIQVIRKEGQFNPDLLLDSFLQALGPDGTLILPAFNFNLKNGETFDTRKTIPITGALAEAALRRPDFRRTRHPLHSFLVSGKHAGALAAMNNLSSFGKDSPFAFFRENDVKMLMIGTGVTEAFTFVHYVEELERVKYRSYRHVRVNYVDADGTSGKKKFMIFAKKPGWTMDLAPLEEHFKEEGFLIERSINGVNYSSIQLGEAFSVIKDDILRHHSMRISRFSMKLYLREVLKSALLSLHLYKTLSEKIAHAPGPR